MQKQKVVIVQCIQFVVGWLEGKDVDRIRWYVRKQDNLAEVECGKRSVLRGLRKRENDL